MLRTSIVELLILRGNVKILLTIKIKNRRRRKMQAAQANKDEEYLKRLAQAERHSIGTIAVELAIQLVYLEAVYMNTCNELIGCRC